MRQLNNNTAQRGVTLIELVVALAIMSLLAMTAAPHLSDYGVNARLREGGNALYAQALFAQSEAIKRNGTVRLTTASNGTVTVTDRTDPTTPVVLRTRTLGEGVNSAVGSIDFGSQGWPTNLTAAAIDLSHTTATCSADYRCPGLRVAAGGAIRLCANNQVSCS